MNKISKYIVIDNSNNDNYITNTYVFSPQLQNNNKTICEYCDNILKYSHCEYCNISYFITQEYYNKFINDFFKTFAQNGFK